LKPSKQQWDKLHQVVHWRRANSLNLAVKVGAQAAQKTRKHSEAFRFGKKCFELEEKD